MKIKSILTGPRIWPTFLTLLFILGYWYVIRQSDSLDSALSAMRVQNDERRAQIDMLLGKLEEQNGRLAELNQSLAAANQKLDKQDRSLAAQGMVLRQATERRIEEIATLPLDAVARDTLIALSLEPPAVQILDDGSLTFTPDAARINLQALERGMGAIAELGIAESRIVNLQDQIGNLSGINTNLNQMLTNKDAEMQARLERAGLKQAETEKELQVVKAKSRKRNFAFGTVGFIVGLIVAAL